jgi:hypothetical protein
MQPPSFARRGSTCDTCYRGSVFQLLSYSHVTSLFVPLLSGPSQPDTPGTASVIQGFDLGFLYFPCVRPVIAEFS